MAKLKKVLTAENGLILTIAALLRLKIILEFGAILLTDTFWLQKKADVFSHVELPICSDYSDLFDAVYNECGEEIEEVYGSGSYKLAIERE